jgi:hypothetical protein
VRRALVLIAAISGILLAGAPAQAATSCPDFTILHNDRIGDLELQHGRYAVKVVNGISCPRTTRLLQKWLQQGNTSGGWVVNARSSSFTKGLKEFRISPDTGGGGGGGGGGTGGRVVCQATFRVLNDDRIGQLQIPAGSYRITVRRISCASASDQFRRFLQFPSGNLPDNWRVRPLRAKFRNAQTGESFRIKRVGR